jgi:AcrR family transcriptional regulator
MTSAAPAPRPWSERAADESPAVRRARARQAQQAQAIIDAGRRLIDEGGDSFTTQELVKEAGVALQTFYRLFGSKDRLLLAVLETMIAEYSTQIDEAVGPLPDPLSRLQFIITSALRTAVEPGGENARFVTAQHWRLSQLFPEDMSRATQPFTDLVARHTRDAVAEGLVESANPEGDAWFVTQLVLATFHHVAFSEDAGDRDAISEQLWKFCRGGIGTALHSNHPMRGKR